MNARVIIESVLDVQESRAQVGCGSARLSANFESAEYLKNKDIRLLIPDGFTPQNNTQTSAVVPIWDYLIGKSDNEYRYVLRRRKRRISPGGWLDPGGI